jgi:hypothetical protein
VPLADLGRLTGLTLGFEGQQQMEGGAAQRLELLGLHELVHLKVRVVWPGLVWPGGVMLAVHIRDCLYIYIYR